MTLGGMALAVGILVDDATVEIENIHRNLGMRKGVIEAILDGARQIAVPAFVSTLCICIVFVPVVFLTGAAKFLFTPLALAVVLAMAASYLLSRTLVPTMIRYLIPSELRLYQGPEGEADVSDAGLIWRVHHQFHKGFEKMRDGYAGILTSALAHRKLVVACFVGVSASCAALYPFIGTDFFPQVDAGQIRLHVALPRRHAHRGDRAEVRASGSTPSGGLSRARNWPTFSTTSACPTAATTWPSPTRDPWSRRWRDPGFAEAGRASFDLGLRARNAQAAESRVSRSDVFLPARRHGGADSEFRIARARWTCRSSVRCATWRRIT